MKTIYFWAPFNSKIGTINSVINSVISIEKYSKKKFTSYLIDSTDEWINYSDKFNVIKLRKNKIDYRKAKKILGWRPKNDINSLIDKMLNNK